MNMDANNDSILKVDPRILEEIFGNPNSPKCGIKPDFLGNTETTNEHDSNSVSMTKLEEPFVAASTHQDYSPRPDDTEEQGREGSQHAPDIPNSKNNDNDNWWPIDAEGDGDDGLQSRFGDETTKSSDPPLTVIDVNAYQQRKNLAHGMMDLALLSANANQLRYVLDSAVHSYYYPNLIFISLSIILQIAVGIMLIMNSQCDVTKKPEIRTAIKVNNITVAGVFLVTIINVFITSFCSIPDTSNIVHQKA